MRKILTFVAQEGAANQRLARRPICISCPHFQGFFFQIPKMFQVKEFVENLRERVAAGRPMICNTLIGYNRNFEPEFFFALTHGNKTLSKFGKNYLFFKDLEGAFVCPFHILIGCISDKI